MYLTVQGKLSLKISDQKMKNVTCAKKVSRIIWMTPYYLSDSGRLDNLVEQRFTGRLVLNGKL